MNRPKAIVNWALLPFPHNHLIHEYMFLSYKQATLIRPIGTDLAGLVNLNLSSQVNMGESGMGGAGVDTISIIISKTVIRLLRLD